MTDELKDLRYGSICSGIEAATVAWHPLGWEPAWFSEIDKFPSEVLKHHYLGVPNHGDFTQILRDTHHPARSVPLDLLVGGTPCQAFSVAGLRRGFDDDRGNLTLEFCRLVGFLRPRWVVWENVPGVLSIDGGRAFGSILGAFRELGYGFAYRILDAQHFGVPQRRRRVFLVGHSGGDWRAPASVLFEPEGVFRDSPKGSKTRKGASRGAATGAGADGGGVAQAFNSYQRTVSDVAHTLPIGLDEEQNAVVDGFGTLKARREGGGFEGAVLTQGDIAGPLDASYYKGQGSRQGGERKFITIQKIAHGEYTDDGTTNTLTARDYKSAADLVVASAREGAHSVIAFHPLQDPIHSEEVSHAMGTGGKQGAASVAVCVPCGFYTTSGSRSTGFMEEVTPTLKCEAKGTASVSVAFKPSHFTRGKDGAPSEIVPPLTADADKGDQDPVVFTAGNLARRAGWAPNSQVMGSLLSQRGDQAPLVAMPYTVRRLTPVECERLQGFPDDYTSVPHRGKPAADGPRYKALGNSMAVPVMRWIGQRIAKVDALLKKM